MRRYLRWIVRVFLAALAFLILLAGVIYAISERRIAGVRSTTAVVVPRGSGGAAALARGEHLARSVLSCTLCHGQNLGGAIYADAGSVGILAGPNLTRGRGGIGATLTDEALVRAIRHGIGRSGRSLIVMPSEIYVHLTESDLAAVMEYVKHAPPVDHEVPRTELRWMGRVLLAAGKLEILTADKTPSIPYPRPVVPGPTAEYGQYLAAVSGCHGCHGIGLSGGTVAGPPGTPPASNLTPHPEAPIATWTEADFARALRTGRRPDDTLINPFMPWMTFSTMTDDEVNALWLYLRGAAPRKSGTK